MAKTLRDYVGIKEDTVETGDYPREDNLIGYSWDDVFEKDPQTFCPRCKNETVSGIGVSRDLDWGMDHMYNVAHGIEGPRYRCDKCNFHYSFPPIKPRRAF
jgi:hypothetical protein